MSSSNKNVDKIVNEFKRIKNLGLNIKYYDKQDMSYLSRLEKVKKIKIINTNIRSLDYIPPNVTEIFIKKGNMALAQFNNNHGLIFPSLICCIIRLILANAK